jgi:hypothetical protein
MQATVKASFQEEQKLKINIDHSTAEAELGRFLVSIGAKTAKLTTDADLSGAIRALDVLRSRIIGTPEGELRLALKAEASELEAKIAEIRRKAESEPIKIPVERAAPQPGAGQSFDSAGKIVEDFAVSGGQAASYAELLAMIKRTAAEANQAIIDGNHEALRNILANLESFRNQYEGTLRFIGTGGLNVRGAWSGGGGATLVDPDRPSVGAILGDFLSRLDKLASELPQAIERSTLTAAQRNVEATDRSAAHITGALSGPAFGGSIANSLETAIRRSTGNRGFFFGS